MKWKTKLGEELYPFEMDDSHLQNTKEMLERWTDALREGVGSDRLGPFRLTTELYYKDWIRTFDEEIRRRAAEKKRAVAHYKQVLGEVLIEMDKKIEELKKPKRRKK